MNKDLMLGSICLSDIPKEEIKAVTCKDGTRKLFLNIAIVPRKEPKTYDNNGRKRTITHFVSCAPKQEERKDGVNYILGDISVFEKDNTPTNYVSPEAVALARPASEEELPF